MGLKQVKEVGLDSLGIRARKEELVFPPSLKVLMREMKHALEVSFYQFPKEAIEGDGESIRSRGLIWI
jgi:hypothetical protein